MLMHEWLKYRDKKIKRLGGAEPADQDVDAVAEEPMPAMEEEDLELPGGAGQPLPDPERFVDVAPISPAPQAPPRRHAAGEQPEGPRSAREVLESLQPSADVRSRLEAVLARQRRLPLEEDFEEEKHGRRRRPAETREQLVGRLLDPTLTLQETALLLGVCPTTVRRYTNRGALQCFRTPGNQRRFKLADVLEFMERREQGEL